MEVIDFDCKDEGATTSAMFIESAKALYKETYGAEGKIKAGLCNEFYAQLKEYQEEEEGIYGVNEMCDAWEKATYVVDH